MNSGPTGRKTDEGREALFGEANLASRTASIRLGAQALWLAREEMKWAWRSYVLSVSIALLFGLAVAVSLTFGVSEFEAKVLQGHGAEELYSAFFVDYLFMLVCAVLGTNALLGIYTRNWCDSSSRLVLFRSLPISAGALVGSRMILMLLTLVVGAVGFFMPVFFVSGLAADLGTKAYLLFCAIWVGYSLLASGVSLYCGFGASERALDLTSYGFLLALLVVVVLLETTEYTGIVERVALIAQGGHGTLLAGLSVLIGGVAFSILSQLTVHRLRTRELSA